MKTSYKLVVELSDAMTDSLVIIESNECEIERDAVYQNQNAIKVCSFAANKTQSNEYKPESNRSQECDEKVKKIIKSE